MLGEGKETLMSLETRGAPAGPGSRGDDTFELYDLKVEVVAGDKPFVCSHHVGDSFLVQGENLVFPEGASFSMYALAALLPMLPAKQRPLHPNDWMLSDAEIACPDPNCGARFRITRVARRTQSHAVCTVVPLAEVSEASGAHAGTTGKAAALEGARWERGDGYVLRPACAEDVEAYWRNFDPLDPEVVRMTGCKSKFAREEVVGFFLECLFDESRCDFVLVAPDGRIVGESVVNEIDPDERCANFRIALFQPDVRGRGLGTWMTCATRDFAFERLGLHRLELDVFSFNERAVRTYEKAGFQREGVRRGAVRDGDGWADDIQMALLEDDWRALR